jgi:hypothetical protein
MDCSKSGFPSPAVSFIEVRTLHSMANTYSVIGALSSFRQREPSLDWKRLRPVTSICRYSTYWVGTRLMNTFWPLDRMRTAKSTWLPARRYRPVRQTQRRDFRLAPSTAFGPFLNRQPCRCWPPSPSFLDCVAQTENGKAEKTTNPSAGRAR